MSTAEKFSGLKRILSGMGSVMVAFSGGVDSTFLLRVATDELGAGAAAITVDAPFHSRHEINDAIRLADAMGVRHLIIDAHGLEIEGLSDNPPDRCYICKKAVFSICSRTAAEHGFKFLADGSNLDDLGDYRPGRRALEELNVRSPLLEAGLTKSDIRLLSRQMGLETWDKPALACLLTRFPHGEEITLQRLAMVECCENFLRQNGFGQFRVRAQGDTARIELEDAEMPRISDSAFRSEVSHFFREQGFRYVSVDLDGYRCGSMNPQELT